MKEVKIMTTIEQKKRNSYYIFMNTIKTLAGSQGNYARAYENLINLPLDERLELINELPDFKDSMDVIMYLEQ